MRRNRFSLYCLEDGDEYFGDIIADAQQCNSSPAARRSRGSIAQPGAPAPQKIRGRLRLAGRALYFDADDWVRPVYCFKFKELSRHTSNDNVGLTTEEVATRVGQGLQGIDSISSSLEGGTHLVFHCEQVALMLQHGEVGPHIQEVPAIQDHIFSFPFGGAQRFVERLAALLYVERAGDSGAAKRRLISQFMEFQEREAPLGLSVLKDPSGESIVKQARCTRIEPLTQERGRMVISNQRVYFKPTFPIATSSDDVELSNVRRVERRRCNFREVGLEVATVNDRILLFSFGSPKDREDVFHCLTGQPSLDRLRVNSLEQMTHRWQVGLLSTFDYLMFLNWASGRSMKDLAQYPVLPWIIADYSSQCLDLSSPSTFRDLSKPIGALNAQRLKGFIERANDLRSIGETPYLFGSHFSNPAYVAYYLIRQRPEYMLVLHGGKMDHGSRIFESLQDTFQSVLSGPTDLKELTPEFFFGDGSFLCSTTRGPDLGMKTDGCRVRRDVALPPWANESPSEFVKLNRMALESELCSRTIHRWIDLVFGYQQDGSNAWSANNVFHPYCYESSITSTNAPRTEDDEVLREAMETHTREFGQMPKKLFFAPHAQRQCGATPVIRVELHRFAPPDSDELEVSRPEPSSSSASLDAVAQRRCAEFVAESCGATADAASDKDLTSTAVAESDDVLVQTRSSGVLALFEQQSVPRDEGAAEGSLRDVERLVADTLDLAHLMEDSPRSSSPTHMASAARPKQPESNSESNNTDNAKRLVYAGHVRTGTKGRLDALAVVQVPADADWIFDDYDDDVSEISMVFACDSVGVVHVVDSVLKKKIRTLSDFGPAGISLAVPVSLGSSSAVLLSSLSGSMFVLDMRNCTCQHDHEECCGSSGMTALASVNSLVVGGGKTGVVKCWRLVHDGDVGGVTIDTNEPVSELEAAMVKVTALALDSAGRRMMAIQNSDVFIANLDEGSYGATLADAVTFTLPSHISKQITHASFGRDHMIMVVGRYDVGHYTLDGTEWGTFPTPFEVVVACPACGGQFSKDALMVASPEGHVAILVSTTGSVIAQFDLGPELAGALVVSGAIGSELVAIADSNGRVHFLQLPAE
jgi:hypothetical protein